MQEGDAIRVNDGVVSEALATMADLGLTMEVVRPFLHFARRDIELTYSYNPPRRHTTQLQTEVAKMSAEAATILSGLGFSQSMIDGPFTALSGGWKSRCSLAGSLLIQSDVLLLDEPSNFLVSGRGRGTYFHMFRLHTR